MRTARPLADSGSPYTIDSFRASVFRSVRARSEAYRGERARVYALLVPCKVTIGGVTTRTDRSPPIVTLQGTSSAYTRARSEAYRGERARPERMTDARMLSIVYGEPVSASGRAVRISRSHGGVRLDTSTRRHSESWR